MSEPVIRAMRESGLPALFEIPCEADGQVMAAGEEIEEVLFRLD